MSICCLHHTSNSSLAQSKCSPSKVPTLAKRLTQQVLAGNISPDTSEQEEPYLWVPPQKPQGKQRKVQPTSTQPTITS